jgi:hypothetical protein
MPRLRTDTNNTQMTHTEFASDASFCTAAIPPQSRPSNASAASRYVALRPARWWVPMPSAVAMDTTLRRSSAGTATRRSRRVCPAPQQLPPGAPCPLIQPPPPPSPPRRHPHPHPRPRPEPDPRPPPHPHPRQAPPSRLQARAHPACPGTRRCSWLRRLCSFALTRNRRHSLRAIAHHTTQ